ncbi:hypothetical protein Hte_010975 [Hypoxylon texense]
MPTVTVTATETLTTTAPPPPVNVSVVLPLASLLPSSSVTVSGHVVVTMLLIAVITTAVYKILVLAEILWGWGVELLHWKRGWGRGRWRENVVD